MTQPSPGYSKIPDSLRPLIPQPSTDMTEEWGDQDSGFDRSVARMAHNTEEQATWQCPDCGNAVTPISLGATRKKGFERVGRYLPRAFCTCHGGAIRRQIAEARWAASDAQGDREAYKMSLLRSCGLANVGMTKSSWLQTTEPRKKAWRFAERMITKLDEGTSAFWWGPFGCGKTHLAYAVATEMVMRHLKGAVVVNWIDRMKEIQHTWKTTDQEGPLWRGLTKSPILFLDDFDKQLPRPEDIGKPAWKLPAPWYMESLYYVIDARYRQRLPTVLISNLCYTDLESVLQEIGGTAVDAVLSRMHRAGAVKVDWGKAGLTEFTGESEVNF